MKFRDAASYGKRQEYQAIAELLRRDFVVYNTLVDDQGIDCIIRVNHNRYLDIQIKARSANGIEMDWAYFPRLVVPESRNNLFFIMYSEGANSYWIVPSQDIIELASQCETNVSQNKPGNSAGRFAIRLEGFRNGKCNPFARFEKYRK